MKKEKLGVRQNCWLHCRCVRPWLSLVRFICSHLRPNDLFPENNWIVPVAKKQQKKNASVPYIQFAIVVKRSSKWSEKKNIHTQISKVSRTKNNDRSWTYFQLTYFFSFCVLLLLFLFFFFFHCEMVSAEAFLLELHRHTVIHRFVYTLVVFDFIFFLSVFLFFSLCVLLSLPVPFFRIFCYIFFCFFDSLLLLLLLLLCCFVNVLPLCGAISPHIGLAVCLVCECASSSSLPLSLFIFSVTIFFFSKRVSYMPCVVGFSIHHKCTIRFFFTPLLQQRCVYVATCSRSLFSFHLSSFDGFHSFVCLLACFFFKFQFSFSPVPFFGH